METVKIMGWVINMLIFSLPFTWYMSYQMYKDLKKKDAIIELQKRIIENGNLR